MKVEMVNGEAAATANRRMPDMTGGESVCRRSWPTPSGEPLSLRQQAEALLRPVVRDLDTARRTAVAELEMDRARRELQQLKAENTELRQRLLCRTVEASSVSARAVAGKRGARKVEAILEYVSRHYQRPMALKDVANHLRMNANYLSGLFRERMGMTFHCYLERLRLAKAQELLSDPLARVCEVACAVGYASPNHFRSVFKARAGLSPSAWRESGAMGDGESN